MNAEQWEELLTRYMAHLLGTQGSAFISSWSPGSEVMLTAEEMRVLAEVREKALKRAGFA